MLVIQSFLSYFRRLSMSGILKSFSQRSHNLIRVPKHKLDTLTNCRVERLMSVISLVE